MAKWQTKYNFQQKQSTGIVMPLSRAKVLEYFDPYGQPPWHLCTSFTEQEVRDAALQHCFVYGHLDPSEYHARRAHIQRIAYLFSHWQNDGADTPQLHIPHDGMIVVNDGWHRIAAFIARDESTLHVSVDGDMDAVEKMIV